MRFIPLLLELKRLRLDRPNSQNNSRRRSNTSFRVWWSVEFGYRGRFEEVGQRKDGSKISICCLFLLMESHRYRLLGSPENPEDREVIQRRICNSIYSVSCNAFYSEWTSDSIREPSAKHHVRESLQILSRQLGICLGQGKKIRPLSRTKLANLRLYNGWVLRCLCWKAANASSFGVHLLSVLKAWRFSEEKHK